MSLGFSFRRYSADIFKNNISSISSRVSFWINITSIQYYYFLCLTCSCHFIWGRSSSSCRRDYYVCLPIHCGTKYYFILFMIFKKETFWNLSVYYITILYYITLLWNKNLVSRSIAVEVYAIECLRPPSTTQQRRHTKYRSHIYDLLNVLTLIFIHWSQLNLNAKLGLNKEREIRNKCVIIKSILLSIYNCILSKSKKFWSVWN